MKTMQKTMYKAGLLLLVALSLTMGLVNYINRPKMAYVRSAELIYQYEGMKEAQLRFGEKTKAWEANVQHLKAAYEEPLRDFREVYEQLSESERNVRFANLKAKEADYKKYQQAIAEKVEAADIEMTEGVLNQVNSFIANYGKSQGYDVILGTTQAGNLLYAKDVIDITDEVLAALNEHYKGTGA